MKTFFTLFVVCLSLFGCDSEVEKTTRDDLRPSVRQEIDQLTTAESPCQNWGYEGCPCTHGVCFDDSVCEGVSYDQDGFIEDPGVCEEE